MEPDCKKILRAIHAINVDNMQRYNVVAIVQDQSLSAMEAAMADKLTVVQKAFWFNTEEKKPEGKYNAKMRVTISF